MRFRQALIETMENSAAWQQTLLAMKKGRFPCALLGLAEGEKGVLAAMLAEMGTPLLVIVPSDEAAGRMTQDLAALTDLRVMSFPARPTTLFRVEAVSREMCARRVGVLGAALTGQVDVVFASADALMQHLAPPSAFKEAMFVLKTGQRWEMDKLALAMVNAGYVREERVEGPGQFAVRGGIVDIFPMGSLHPVRVEFFDDEIDVLRSFDEISQRSVERLERVEILPAGECPVGTATAQEGLARIKRQTAEGVRRLKMAAQREKAKEDTMAATARLTGAQAEKPWERLQRQSGQWEQQLTLNGRFEGMENLIAAFYPQIGHLTDYLQPAFILMDEPQRCRERVENTCLELSRNFEDAMGAGAALPMQAELATDFDALTLEWEKFPMVTMACLPTSQAVVTPKAVVRAQSRGTISVRGQFDLLKSDIRRWRETGTRGILMAGSARRAQHLQSTLTDFQIFAAVVQEDRPLDAGELAILPITLQQGFELDGMAVLSERELFGASRTASAVSRTKRSGRVLDVFTDLNPGDLVVHEVHGIGRFDGVTKLSTDGVTRDYVKITYRGDDVLYVPTEQLDRVQKYIGGGEDHQPMLSHLGGTEWRKTKGRVAKQIQDIADELVTLYAQRQANHGYAFGPDTPWQREMEEAFPYEETADQLKAIEEIKDDMESDRAMDRLLCGDVGYGKTEVALRAAFKAVMSGKQVAFLAPTTVLAHQHYKTILERFEGFSVRVEELSRFRSSQQIKESLDHLVSGQADIVVGTHRILSRDVVFKDLGLLIVDEEQRFGVTQKEKIKRLRASVDVLTLTATPIPRTLHMSMVSIRDISVLDTPPEDRYPVQTMVTEYDDGMIRDAIYREVGRGGQVYFLYNRVESIDHMYRRLSEMLPGVRIAVGHGQMPEQKLEQIMMDFSEGNTDVLLSTTIIESGLDIPKANTLIVYDADRFGLSQLYQLRGRVGRSNRLAYAYFTFQREKILSETAEKRLQAIREFTQFGSGFRVAMRDLEIRGAGNLLGTQQSGHMAAVGYGMYCKMIEEAVNALQGRTEESVVDPNLDVKVDAYLPSEYVHDATDRLELYRRIAALRTPEERQDVTDELIDRFGEPPASALRLMDVAQLRSHCIQIGIDSVRQDGLTCMIRFVPKAPIDGMKLFLLLGQKQNMALIRKDPPTLRLILRKEDEPLTLLLKITEELCTCRLEN